MRSFARFSLLLGGLAAVTACREPPSWAVRWRIAPRPGMEIPPTTDDEDALVNSVECSRVGVSVIDLVSTIPDFDPPFVVDRRFKPCWAHALENPDRTLGGPALQPGSYELIARALRTNGEPWTYCFIENGVEVCGDPSVAPRCEEGENGPQCQRGYRSCACRFLDVVEDETIHIRDLVIDAPPECEDGIDGDGDGLVDEMDPGCQVGNQEDIDVINTQLVLDFTLLSGNPAATCVGVQVSRFEVSFDGQIVSTPSCRLGPLGLNLSIEPGPHEVSVRGLAFDGTPVTRAESHTVEATPSGALDPPVIAIDFADTDFLDPIESEAIFGVSFVPVEGALRYCEPRTEANPGGARGRLRIEDVSIAILDAGGSPAPPTIAREPDALAGMRLDGSPLPCVQQSIITESLRWGAYRVQVEAMSPEGEVCFSNVGDAALLAPGVRVDVQVPRVEPIPTSCRDCATDDHCGGWACRDGVCVPP